MTRDDQRQAARELWLLDLADALGEAERLVAALARCASESREAVLVRTKIKAARAEVDALQRGGLRGVPPVEIDPLWTRPSRPRHDQTP